MPSYLVESYLPRAPHALEDASDQARQVADFATTNGLGVRYVRTTLLGADETCFHSFDAMSLENLEAALAGVGLVVDRIVESDETPSAAPPHP